MIAVEPHPQISGILEQNLKAHQLTNCRVVRAAVGDHCGAAVLTLGTAGRAAYSSLLSLEDADERVEVAIITLDELAASHSIEEIDLLKLDVEGVEIEALAGARQLLSEGRIRYCLWSSPSKTSIAAGTRRPTSGMRLRRAGYDLHRLNDDLALEPAVVSEPIAYENLFAVRDTVDGVNAQLKDAPSGRRRVAEQIIRRGLASTNLYNAAARIAPFRRQLDDSASRLQEQERKLHDATGRILEQERKLRDATSRIQEQERRIVSLEARAEMLRQLETTVRQDYDRVRNSRSWRYTRPLRVLADLVVGADGSQQGQ